MISKNYIIFLVTYGVEADNYSIFKLINLGFHIERERDGSRQNLDARSTSVTMLVPSMMKRGTVGGPRVAPIVGEGVARGSNASQFAGFHLFTGCPVSSIQGLLTDEDYFARARR